MLDGRGSFPGKTGYFSFPKRLEWLWTQPVSCSGSVVVIVLVIGPKVRGFKPSRGLWNFKGHKICSTALFGREVKPEAPSHKIIRLGKDPFDV
jgi:hypothetical protein